MISLRKKRRLKRDTTEVLSLLAVKLFGLHFCDVGIRQLDINNDVPQGVNEVCLRDPVIA